VRDCVRRVGAFAAAASLAACAGATTSPALHQWQLAHRNDPIFGANLTAVLSMGHGYNIASGDILTGALELKCFKSKPIVVLAFNYKVGSNTSAAVSYRFDDKPGVDAKARFLRNYSTIVIDDPSEVRRFVADLSTANRLWIRIDSLMVNDTNIELDVRGGGLASEQALANCPLPPVVADRRT